MVRASVHQQYFHREKLLAVVLGVCPSTIFVRLIDSFIKIGFEITSDPTRKIKNLTNIVDGQMPERIKKSLL